MTTKYLDCRNCGDMQDFRPLTDEEKDAVRSVVEVSYVHDYWRCTAVGCLRFQRWYAKRDGASLPEEFRVPAPPEAE
ncbi:hypothetical protein ACWCQK_08345 [Streptomyces sp. NPDC002306]